MTALIVTGLATEKKIHKRLAVIFAQSSPFHVSSCHPLLSMLVSYCGLTPTRIVGEFYFSIYKNTLVHSYIQRAAIGQQERKISNMTSDAEEEFPVLVDGFMSVSDDTFCDEPELRWYCAPDSWQQQEEKDTGKGDETNKREGKDGSWSVDDDGQLVVQPPAKKDFWRKTYYEPLLVKDDGPCLFATVPMNKAITATAEFTIGGTTRQFDQAGLCVRLDSDHWLKTGIEIVDGIPRLSCVCTNVYSDWSTQIYWKPQATNVKIRLHILPNQSIVVEAWDETRSSWNFIRIAHLSLAMKCDPDPLQDHPTVTKAWAGKGAPKGHLYGTLLVSFLSLLYVCRYGLAMQNNILTLFTFLKSIDLYYAVGVFACCPEDQTGTTVTFHDLKVVAGSTFKHNADGNHE
jgi:regulation of enolase protein 1 (concanavalin A-like superfamily)